MRWTTLNSVGASFWILGLCFARGVVHPESWSVWLPFNALAIGGILGSVGLATLLWANLGDA